MKGLELSEKFYYECGRPMMIRKFPGLFDLLAFGLAGPGSECFGYDDEISRDHDFEPGFCIFTPEPLDGTNFTRKDFFELERAYSYLPKEFAGVPRLTLLPVGGSRRGVMSVGDFYRAKIGRTDVFGNPEEWFGIPEQYLAEATNGKVFEDRSGEFTRIRNALLDMPSDVRKKKIAGSLLDIKPIIEVTDDGKLEVFEKVRGRKKSIERVIQIIGERCRDLDQQIVAVVHADCEKECNEMIAEIRRRYGVNNIFKGFLGCAIGAHTGPGLIGITALGSASPYRHYFEDLAIGSF